MAGILLFSGYLALIGWLLWRLPFFAKSGIPVAGRWGLLALKMMAAAAYGWLFTHLPNYATAADTWRFHYAALTETDWLLSDPQAWLADLYTPRYTNDGGLLATQNSFANDLKDLLFLKLLSLLNLLSGGRYYLNCLLFSFISFFGIVALARCWQQLLRLRSALYPLLAILLWPSVLFWTSGLHRDGLLLHAVGMACWLGWQLWRCGGRHLLFWLLLFLHLGLVAVLRGYALPLLLLAALLGAWMYVYQSRRAPALALFVLVLCLCLWALGSWQPQWALPSVLAQRQAAFETLAARSELAPLPVASWQQWAQSLPAAWVRALLVPPLGVPWRLSDLPFAAENIAALLLLWPAWRWLRGTAGRHLRAWLLAAAFLLGCLWLLVAFTVPVGTAIVRYKSIWWPFITPWLLWPLAQRLLPAPWLRQTTPKP